LGNPFTDDPGVADRRGITHVPTAADAVVEYRRWLTAQLNGEGTVDDDVFPAVEFFQRLVVLARRPEGVTLVCWCDPAPCHAHVLAEVLGQFV
jgi:hypothetical protein